ncbi:MAG: potassium channel family protein [Terriglobales bacterium]
MGQLDPGVAKVLAGIAGWAMLAFVLRDAFETMILPRRLNGRFRFTRLYYQSIWPLWSAAAVRLRGRRRESALSLFGPLSMLLLFVLWAVVLVGGFACVYWSLGSPLRTPEPLRGFGMDVYLSGVTLLTIGIGGAVPHTAFSRVLAVAEGGLGLGFVAIIISYLPVLYAGFSRRETSIAMLDARAGSPPSASELLRRHAGALSDLQTYLAEWERWSAELLESHISYPVLGYFRSQHVNQSWLAALGTMLDACALLLAGCEEDCTRQAQLTFAAARHAVVDLAQIFIHQLPGTVPDRLPSADLSRLQTVLAEAGVPLRWDAANVRQLAALRQLYEPHLLGIAAHLKLEPPRWLGNPKAPDNWQRSPWDRFVTGATGVVRQREADRHY